MRDTDLDEMEARWAKATDAELLAFARQDIAALIAEVRRENYNELSRYLRAERGLD